MKTSMEVQWGFRKSTPINTLGECVYTDVSNIRTKLDAMRLVSPLGYSFYGTVHSVDGVYVTIAGQDLNVVDLTGGIFYSNGLTSTIVSINNNIVELSDELAVSSGDACTLDLPGSWPW
jgi:hypothetical protein